MVLAIRIVIFSEMPSIVLANTSSYRMRYWDEQSNRNAAEKRSHACLVLAAVPARGLAGMEGASANGQ